MFHTAIIIVTKMITVGGKLHLQSDEKSLINWNYFFSINFNSNFKAKCAKTVRNEPGRAENIKM